MKYTLENVTVPNPCPMRWEQMTGNDEVRHCAACRHIVYDISEMPKRRALKVLNQPENTVCVSYYRDDENRVVTLSYYDVFKRNFAKVCGVILAVIFSLNSLYAIQTKTSTSRKKKVAKYRKHKKQVKPLPRPVVGKRAPSKKTTPKKRIIGMPIIE